MTDETTFKQPPQLEVMRFDETGDLVWVHPQLAEHIGKQLEPGLCRWQKDLESKLSAAEALNAVLAARVTALESQYLDLARSFSNYTVNRLTVTSASVEYLETSAKDARESLRSVFGEYSLTLESLVPAIEERFRCRDGYYGSHADGPSRIDLSIAEAKKDQESRDIFRYRTLGFITNAGEGAAERLRSALLDELHKLYSSCQVPKPLLYWRYAKQERIQEDQEENRLKIRTRVAIPQADWSVARVKSDHAPFVEI